MTDPRVRLKDRFLAGFLAWLLPGAGHFYQGRFFKGAVFSACILATFTYGLALGDWQGVYFQEQRPSAGRKRAWGYAAQVGVGLPALTALVQYKRCYSEANLRPAPLAAPISAPFIGEMAEVTEGVYHRVHLEGTISIRPIQGEFGPDSEGEFTGTMTAEGQKPKPVTLKLSGAVRLGPPVAPYPGRPLTCYARSDEPGGANNPRQIDGEIPRPLADRFEVPMDEEALQRIHGRLGKYFELSLVYTWIAGLLNILAVWDAVEGPAYGYGDEESEPNADDKKSPAKPEGAPPGTTAGAGTASLPTG